VRPTPPTTGLHIFVAGLDFKATAGDLQSLLEPFGPCTDVRLGTRSDGRATGFAHVTLGDDDAVDAAIAGLDGKDWRGRVLLVERARKGPPGERSGRQEPQEGGRGD